ncbi:unnamed protein product [Prorocentrum cordatum]|uniref:Uncharacterized protein n=1 Tax=Prorocentrum cordatum TaxID=2364126 RepID=A0ABN9SZR8_9DINO|nr:unnamed protein product [Polarella glacialis]
MLRSEFSLDWSLGLSRLAVAPFAMGAPGAAGGPADKCLRADPALGRNGAPGSKLLGAAARALGAGKGGNNSRDTTNVEAMLSELANMAGRHQPSAVQAFVGAKHRGSPTDEEAIGSIMGTRCRHCLLGGRKLAQRGRAQRMAEDNGPATPRSLCAHKPLAGGVL